MADLDRVRGDLLRAYRSYRAVAQGEVLAMEDRLRIMERRRTESALGA